MGKSADLRNANASTQVSVPVKASSAIFRFTNAGTNRGVIHETNCAGSGRLVADARAQLIVPVGVSCTSFFETDAVTLLLIPVPTRSAMNRCAEAFAFVDVPVEVIRANCRQTDALATRDIPDFGETACFWFTSARAAFNVEVFANTARGLSWVTLATALGMEPVFARRATTSGFLADAPANICIKVKASFALSRSTFAVAIDVVEVEARSADALDALARAAREEELVSVSASLGNANLALARKSVKPLPWWAVLNHTFALAGVNRPSVTWVTDLGIADALAGGTVPNHVMQ